MILSQMKSNIPSNIARNVALKENVFMMLVCIELKIPLFVIGKPGSSKSLAKSIVENSMQGVSSSNKLCKKLKQVSVLLYLRKLFTQTVDTQIGEAVFLSVQSAFHT